MVVNLLAINAGVPAAGSFNFKLISINLILKSHHRQPTLPQGGT